MESSRESNNPVNLPRITIQFCTQCKWMLRAAYVSQKDNTEVSLLSLFLFEYIKCQPDYLFSCRASASFRRARDSQLCSYRKT